MKINEKALYKEVGKRIREHRMLLGMTQSQLGDAIGLLRTSVVNIEAGRQKTPLHILYGIAMEFQIEPREIMPSVSELDGPDLVTIHFGGHSKEVPAKAADMLNRLLEQTAGR